MGSDSQGGVGSEIKKKEKDRKKKGSGLILLPF